LISTEETNGATIARVNRKTRSKSQFWASVSDQGGLGETGEIDRTAPNQSPDRSQTPTRDSHSIFFRPRNFSFTPPHLRIHPRSWQTNTCTLTRSDHCPGDHRPSMRLCAQQILTQGASSFAHRWQTRDEEQLLVASDREPFASVGRLSNKSLAYFPSTCR